MAEEVGFYELQSIYHILQVFTYLCENFSNKSSNNFVEALCHLTS